MSDRSGDFSTVARTLAGLAGVMLGWSPETYWASTPEDLAIALSAFHRGDSTDAPVGRDALNRLQEQFPDDRI